MIMLGTYGDSEEGAVAIEAVFAIPLLILIGFGAIDGSLLLMQNHKAENGLVSAGNYLAKTPAPATFEMRAKRLATTGQMTTGGDRKITNWSDSDITINYKSISNTETGSGRNYRGGDTVRVVQLSTSIPFQGLGFFKSVSGGAITIQASYEERLIADRS